MNKNWLKIKSSHRKSVANFKFHLYDSSSPNIGGEIEACASTFNPCVSFVVLHKLTTTLTCFQVNIVPSRVAQMTKSSAEWKRILTQSYNNHCFHFHNIVDMIFFYSRTKKIPIKNSVLCASVFYSTTLHFLITKLLLYNNQP
jgi:hypothetical protein